MKGLKTIIIILIVLLLIGGGAFAYLLLKTDVFLTNEQAFLKYLAQEENVLNNFSKYNELQKVNEEAYSSDAELELNVEMGEEELTARANINTVKDGDNIFSEIGVNYQEEDFLKFKYLKEEDKHGIQFPGVKQYIVLENEDLKEFAKKLGLEDENTLELIPDKISGIYPDELTILTEEEKEQIKNLVTNCITKNISEDRYVKQKAVTVTVNNQKMSANEYSIELTEKDMLNISKSVLEEIKGNEVLLHLIENKIDYIMHEEEIDIFTGFIRLIIVSNVQAENGMIQNAGSEERTEIEITIDTIIEVFNEAIESLQEEIDEFNEEEVNSVKFSIYENGGKTIKIKLEQSQEQESYNSYVSDEDAEISILSSIIEIDNLENEVNKSNIILTIKSYLDDELQQGQATQILLENQEGVSILKEEIKDLKEEKIVSTSEMKISREGQTIETEGNISTEQEDLSMNIGFKNTIQIENNDIEETLEGNEVVLNELSLKQIQKIVIKVVETLEKEIQKKFSQFSLGEGNSTLGLLESVENTNKVEEANQ